MTARHETVTESDLLTPWQVAALLGISDRTLYRYEDRGLVHPRRTKAGHRRFDRAEIEQLRNAS